tara:strand:+ start:17055 stop:18617 length:1563 start_codon:yes stop_codon:yes gene_type:complete
MKNSLELLKAHNTSQEGLHTISVLRKANISNLLMKLSLQYRAFVNGPNTHNPYADPKLNEEIIKDKVRELEEPGGILEMQTILKTNAQNMPQHEIKFMKQKIERYWKSLGEIEELGGALIVAVEDVMPQNLPDFIANLQKVNFNGTNERERDLSVLMALGWGNCFDYTPEVRVRKSYYYDIEAKKSVFTQAIAINMFGDIFQKHFKTQKYIQQDVYQSKNIVLIKNTPHYVVEASVDSNQIKEDNFLSIYISQSLAPMQVGDAWTNAGIEIEGNIQPQFFLGGDMPTGDEMQDAQNLGDVFIEDVKGEDDELIQQNQIRFVNTEAIDGNMTYKSEKSSFLEGLFAVGSGNPGILYAFATNNLKIDLPQGFFEPLNGREVEIFNSKSPIEQAGWIGNRYKFSMIGTSNTPISMLDAQKAWFFFQLSQNNLDRKLQEGSSYSKQPSFIKRYLTSDDQLMIDHLNEYDMPIPEFYRSQLGITEWQQGMIVYYQNTPQEVINEEEELAVEADEATPVFPPTPVI